uniref:Uncharacterized protein n=1 Tax=Parascaris equorum TaxID=6256 RepID=A0A914S303_PAREQ
MRHVFLIGVVIPLSVPTGLLSTLQVVGQSETSECN